jgi:hypothetical protein
MLDVAGGGEKRHRCRAGELDEMVDGDGCWRPSQLGPVAARELLEAGHVVAVPTP